MKKILIRLAYNGNRYNGWQIQPNGISVQETIEKALSEIAKTNINIVGSGRTDSKVHALCQYAHFNFPLRMTTNQIKLALTSKLSNNIKILSVLEAPDDFHARFSAVKRGYVYFIAKARNPFNQTLKSFFARKNINIDHIEACLNTFLGEHDFSSFAKPNPDLKHYRCTIEEIKFTEREHDYVFEIKANRFLHNMVRRIVGCLINISHDEKSPQIISEIFQMKQMNQKYLFTAPPDGLYLCEVDYQQEFLKEDYQNLLLYKENFLKHF